MIVLASQSPRRRRLLDMLGIDHRVDPADIDESRRPGETADTFAARLARAKATVGAAKHPDHWVLGADTVVVLDGAILGKPTDAGDAERMLATLAGRRHEVVTAVALARGTIVHGRVDHTTVWFRTVTPASIREYVATGEPLDKAGAYGAQGLGSVFIERIEGDFYSVMGLPVRLVIDLLDEAGIPYSFTS